MTKLKGGIMRIYNYKNKWEQFLTPDIVSMLTQIHEYKGKQNLFIESSADALNGLIEIAKIQSTEASNKIEGIYTSDERIKKLALAKTNPKNRAEEEIAGYRDVLNTIHSNHDGIPLKPRFVHSVTYTESISNRLSDFPQPDFIFILVALTTATSFGLFNIYVETIQKNVCNKNHNLLAYNLAQKR